MPFKIVNHRKPFLLAGGDFFPILEKSLYAFIRQGMICQLTYNLVRYGGNMGAHKGGFQDVPRMSYTGNNDLCRHMIIIKNSYNIIDYFHAIMGNVIKSPHKRTYIGSTCLGRH